MLQACDAITSVTIAHRIKLAREALGLSQVALAELVGVSPGTIGNAESGAREQPRKLRLIAEALGVHLIWLETGVGPREVVNPSAGGTQAGVPLAQPVNLRSVTIAPYIDWEQLLRAPLPATFLVAMPDDSMTPRVRAGKRLVLDSTQAPSPGDGVLVADRDGNAYLRTYRKGRSGAWQAVPLNDAYQTLDSDQDGLRVLAVLVGEEGRWT